MTQNKLSTEEIIKNAAMEVFVEDGFDGARMQKIADKAQVNKAMLHYYFSSKEILFEKILTEAFMDIRPELEAIIHGNEPFIEKLKSFVRIHFKHQLKNPKVASFIFRELNKNPERIATQIKNMQMMKGAFCHFMETYKEEVDKGILRAYSPFHLFIMLQGLVDYYPMSKPFYSAFFQFLDQPVDDEEFTEKLINETCSLLENALVK